MGAGKSRAAKTPKAKSPKKKDASTKQRGTSAGRDNNPKAQPSRSVEYEVRLALPRRRGAGAPLSPPTRWLQEQMRKLKELDDYPLLFLPWMERYKQHKGDYPADPRRAFHQAAEGCKARIQQERTGR